jgi:hypothetical protein
MGLPITSLYPSLYFRGRLGGGKKNEAEFLFSEYLLLDFFQHRTYRLLLFSSISRNELIGDMIDISVNY